MASAQSPLGRMHNTYGRSLTARCRQCCNYQLKEKGSKDCICIAYSDTLSWNGMSEACLELFNYPFRGIRPRLTPLENMYSQRTPKAANIEGQQSLF